MSSEIKVDVAASQKRGCLCPGKPQNAAKNVIRLESTHKMFHLSEHAVNQYPSLSYTNRNSNSVEMRNSTTAS